MRRVARAVLQQADGRATGATETARADSDWERSPSAVVVGLTRLADERLARAVANGDERAFATIYERYHQELYRYCYWIVRNGEDAYDALQSTLLRSLSALQRRQRDAPLRPWLFRIAHNESISLIRRRETASAPVDVSDRSAPSAEESASERAHLALLVSDLHELPPRQRSALLLRELSGLSHREIAVTLEISMHTVKHAIADGRRSLAEQQEGRTMRCQSVRQSIGYHDKRVLRSLRVRAHLRDCPSCAELAATTRTREAGLRLLVPPLAPLVAAGLLARVHHAAGAPPATSTGGGLFAGASGKSLGAALATKTVAAAAIVVTTAATATASAKLLTGSEPARHAERVAPAALHAAGPAGSAWRDRHAGARDDHGSSVGAAHARMTLTVASVPAPATPAIPVTGSAAVADLQLGQAVAQQASVAPDRRLVATVIDLPMQPSAVPPVLPSTSVDEEPNTAPPQSATEQTGEGAGDEGRAGNGPAKEGHGGEAQGGNGHAAEGRSGEAHGGEGRGGNGHAAEGRSGEGHGGEGRGANGHAAEGHGGNGHATEGRVSEGRGGEGHGYEGRSAEGRGGEHHTGIGHFGEGHPRDLPMSSGTAHSHTAGSEPVPGGEADDHGRSQEGAEQALDRGRSPGAAVQGEQGSQRAGSMSSGAPEAHAPEKPAAAASRNVEEQLVDADPDGRPEGAAAEGNTSGAAPERRSAGGGPSGVPAESVPSRAGGTGVPPALAPVGAAAGGPSAAHDAG